MQVADEWLDKIQDTVFSMFRKLTRCATRREPGGSHLQDQGADIEELLAKHGANGFAYATEGHRSLVAFSTSGRRVQIMLLMPPINDYARTARNTKRTAAAQQSAWAQVCRQRWRVATMIIKAKLQEEASVAGRHSRLLIY